MDFDKKVLTENSKVTFFSLNDEDMVVLENIKAPRVGGARYFLLSKRPDQKMTLSFIFSPESLNDRLLEMANTPKIVPCIKMKDTDVDYRIQNEETDSCVVFKLIPREDGFCDTFYSINHLSKETIRISPEDFNIENE